MDRVVHGEGIDGGSTPYSNSWRQGRPTLPTAWNTVNPNAAGSRSAASSRQPSPSADNVSPHRVNTHNHGESQYPAGREPVSAYPASMSSTTLVQQVEEFLARREIRRRLENALENADSTDEDFVGNGDLLDIWSSDRVERFLKIFNLPNDNASVQYIRKNCVQILSLLVAVKFTHWERFRGIVHERRDSSIPFTKETLRHNSFLGAEDYLYDWFYHRQNSFHPVVIEEGEIKEYSTSQRLPFIRSERVDLGEGSYGKVTREVIALGQYKYKDSQSTNTDIKKVVARKRFQAGPDYEKEAAILKTLNKSLSSHDHIVRYLAMLVIGDGDGTRKEFNIILPCADMDLKMFLDLESNFSTTDLIKAASKLADAMEWLHADHYIDGQKLTCCHMDLKLDNILVYNLNEGDREQWPVGMWKISDFGISSLEASPGESRTQTGGLKAPRAPLKGLTSTTIRIPAKRRSAAYQAPEIAAGGDVGRSSDVWSFGCILFQVLARGIGPGKAKMEELDRLRTLEQDTIKQHPTDYFYREENGIKYLNPHVKNWLKSAGQRDSYIVKDCKGLIFDMLNIKPDLRPKSKLVNERLSRIAHSLGSISRPEPTPAIPEEADATQSLGDDVTYPLKPVPSISISKPETSDATDGSLDPAQNTSQRAPPMSTSQTRPFTARGQPASRGRSPPGTASAHQESQTRLENATRRSLPTPGMSIPRKPLSNEARGVTTGSTSDDSLSALPAPRSLSLGDARSREIISAQERASQFPDRHAAPVPESNRRFYSHRPSSVNTQASRTMTQSSSSSGSQILSPTTSIDSTEFTEVKDALMALMCSISAKQAFVTPTKIYIRTMSNPRRHCTITIKDHKWDSGSLAGNYLCVVGKDIVSMTRKVLLFKLSMTDGFFDSPLPILDVRDQPAHFHHVVVSQDGQLLFEDENCAWLYKDHLDIHKKELTVNTERVIKDPKSYLREDLQRLWFSEDGLWAVVHSSSPNNLHFIRMWSVDNINRGRVYQYQHNNSSSKPIRCIIPFPKSSRCILWDEHSNVCILAPTEQKTARPFLKIENLQAIAITPDENHAIFIIRGTKIKKGLIRRCSNIWSSRLQPKNGHLALTEPPFKPLGALDTLIETPEGCAITVDAVDCPEGYVNLHVLHPNGKLDQKRISYGN